MKTIDFESISSSKAYHWMVNVIVPRPIAWVGTVSASGNFNLAPFSFFTGVCSNPPTLLFCPVLHPDGREKDTLRNIRETRCFTVNSASVDHIDHVHQSSEVFPPEVSEFEKTNLTPIPSLHIAAPRLAEASVQLECTLQQIIDISPVQPGVGAGSIVIGTIRCLHVNELILEQERISIEKLNPLARIGGPLYSNLGEILKPKLEQP